MASFSRAATIADEDEQFDRSGTLRLAAWGFTAVIAVTAAVLAGRTDIGFKRVEAAVAQATAPPSELPQATVKQLLARTADTEREARRLNETVRTLTSERDRLAMRLGMVEREMGDLTGSISRAPANQNQTPGIDPKMAPSALSPMPLATTALAFPPPATIDAQTSQSSSLAGTTTQPIARPVPVSSVAPSTAETTPDVTLNASNFVPLPMPRPSEQITLATQAAPTPAASPPAPAADQADATPSAVPPVPAARAGIAEAQPRAPIGVDLGPALTMARLRARWAAFRATYGSLADGLRPVISIHEAGPGKPLEMRLVVGPMADANAAARLCATLAGSQFFCHPAAFDGQRLALR